MCFNIQKISISIDADSQKVMFNFVLIRTYLENVFIKILDKSKIPSTRRSNISFSISDQFTRIMLESLNKFINPKINFI